uniref:Uncharacterized protein n=1 Tax=Rangifer tarandus platyrhynchus TaxID=3082113 RepID=A0ACB0EVY5_RANTA|nr:unnamed protein product [Rangifer tarandus platyrhynchus]
MWLARAQGVTGFEPASEMDPTGARRERPQENETRRCGKTKPNPPRPARHRHLPVQVPESRTRAPRRHPCSPPPPGHCSAERVPDPCLRPTSVVTARRIDPGVRRGLHSGSSRVGSPQYLAQESPVGRLLPWGSRASAFIEAGTGPGRGGNGRGSRDLGGSHVRRGPGLAQVRRTGSCAAAGGATGDPGDPGPSPGAAQLLPSLTQRSGGWGQQPAFRERPWDKAGVPETKPGASQSGRAGDGRVGGAAAALFGFLSGDSYSGKNTQKKEEEEYSNTAEIKILGKGWKNTGDPEGTVVVGAGGGAEVLPEGRPEEASGFGRNSVTLGSVRPEPLFCAPTSSTCHPRLAATVFLGHPPPVSPATWTRCLRGRPRAFTALTVATVAAV